MFFEKVKKIYAGIVAFFTTTKLGHQIKSAFVTFTGMFIGSLFLTPEINELFKSNLPTISQLSDVWPVVLDAFYRSLWAFFLLEIGVYKYNSSAVEANKPAVIPTDPTKN